MSLFLLLVCLTANCQTQCGQKPTAYQLVDDGGIMVEKFDSTNVDQNRYTANNLIFRANTQFVYAYQHMGKEGKTWLVDTSTEGSDWQHGWKFVPIDSARLSTIDNVKITVEAGLEPFIKNIPDYNQTVIRFDYPTRQGTSNFHSVSGVVENEKNVWMHPPRDKYFKILELNPFPFIRAPYVVGTAWTWSLKIGSMWGSSRWKTWEGTIENTCHYEITDKGNVATALGNLECLEVTATASSRLGKTKLTALFNRTHGFVRLHYVNIDSSQTRLELIKHEEIEADEEYVGRRSDKSNFFFNR